MGERETTDPRKKAWVTRRQKYGPKGHSGYYSRRTLRQQAVRIALENIGQARRQCQMLLPCEQAHRAIDRIDIAESILERLEK